MKRSLHLVGIAALGLAGVATLGTSRAVAQDPILTPIIVDTALPIIVNAVTPKPKDTGLAKFQGFVMNANVAQLTVRAKGNDMAVRTFALSQPAAYQYGDKITVYYDPQSQQAMKFKGKPSASP